MAAAGPVCGTTDVATAKTGPLNNNSDSQTTRLADATRRCLGAMSLPDPRNSKGDDQWSRFSRSAYFRQLLDQLVERDRIVAYPDAGRVVDRVRYRGADAADVDPLVVVLPQRIAEPGHAVLGGGVRPRST